MATFDDTRHSPAEVDKYYINERQVSSAGAELDDMYAALGDFALRMVITGSVCDIGYGRHSVSIKEVGVYAYDHYDFNNYQHLGFWNPDTNYVGKNWNSFWYGDGVTNAHFRDWRDKNNRGGDFEVFSDMKIVPLNQPVTFIK